MFDFSAAEYSTVGCFLVDSRCLPIIRGHISSPEAFASGPCRKAFAAACELADNGQPIDPVTVGRAAGLDNRFLVQCMELVPSCTGAAQYAQTVVEGSQRRQLRELGDKLQTDSLTLDTDVTQLLAEARAALDGLAGAPGNSAAQSPSSSLRDFLSFRAEVNEGKRQAVKTGFPSLDGILGGFACGGLYVIAARPGVGKSALSIALADVLAREHAVLYASLEMSAEKLNARRVAAFSAAPCTFGKLLFGKTSAEEDAAIVNACGALAERKLHILAVPTLTVLQLEIQARNVHAQVVIVDYLGLLSTADRRANEYERIAQVSGDLKRLAKRLGCVVIALCQLNRESTTGSADTRPKLSQLRSSGAIEHDADGVLLLHRPEYGQTETQRNPAEPQQFFVDVAKNRHGRTGTAELAWYAPMNRFVDRSGRWEVRSWAWLKRPLQPSRHPPKARRHAGDSVRTQSSCFPGWLPHVPNMNSSAKSLRSGIECKKS